MPRREKTATVRRPRRGTDQGTPVKLRVQARFLRLGST